MKKVLFSIAILILILTMTFAVIGCMNIVSRGTYDNADKYLVGPQTYENGELSTLIIDWYCGEIHLVEDENATAVTVEETNTLSDSHKVHSYYHDGVLEVRFWKSGLSGNVNEKHKHLTVTYKSAQDIDIQMTSGTLRATTLTADNATIKMTSGEILIDTVRCDTLRCEMTSGDMDVGTMECTAFRFGMSSGDCAIDTIKATNVIMSQSSGEIVIGSLDVDSFTSDSTSGDLDATFARADRISIEMTSGDAVIGIPENGATVSLVRTSGIFKTDLPYSVDLGKYIFGDGHCVVGIQTTSGSVRIK